MASGNIIGKTNVPQKYINYVGIDTDTADITIDNREHTFQVDVKKVPESLTFDLNNLYCDTVSYCGDEQFTIDLSPIIINDEDFEDYGDFSLTKIYRVPNGDNYTEAPYYIIKEEKEALSANVDITLANKKNNDAIAANLVLTCLDNDMSSFIGSVEAVNLFGNLFTQEVPQEVDDGEEPVSETVTTLNTFRLGSNKNLGSLTLNLNYGVHSITFRASRYYNENGNIDSTSQLFVNGIEVALNDDLTLTTVNFPTAVSTIIFENRRSSGTQGGRVYIDYLATGEGGTSYSERHILSVEEANLDGFVRYIESNDGKKIAINLTDDESGSEINTTISLFIDDRDIEYAYLDGNLNVSNLLVNDNLWVDGAFTVGGNAFNVSNDDHISLNDYVRINTTADDCYFTIANQDPESAFLALANGGGFQYDWNVNFCMEESDIYAQEGDSEVNIVFPYRSGRVLFDNDPNIAKKGQTLITSGTFDENGEFVIDTTETTIPDGMYFVTYGNAQGFIFISADMLANADLNPLRAPIPVIYGEHGETYPGMLKITRYGTDLIVKVALDNDAVVREGFTMYFFKTNLA